MKKKVVAIILALLVAAGAGGYGIFRWTNAGSSSSAEASVPVLAVADMQSDSAAVNNRFNGVVETQKKKNITLDSEKSVEKILVSEGDHVNEKDALFIYDTEKTMLEISQKELAKEKLNGEIEGLRQQINQLNTELGKGNLSSADRMSMNAQVLENQTSIAQAEYDLKVADSEINALNASVKNSTVRAPMSGTIEKLQDPETMTDPSAAFMVIVADGDFRIKGTMSEQSIGTVYEGMQMRVRSRLNEEDTWIGTVSSLESRQEENQEDMGMTNESTEQASRYAFYVTLDTKENLMLGQHVTLEPYYEEQMEGLVLSTGCIVTEEDGKTYVYAVKKPGDRLEKRAVETGTVYEEQGMVQILSGLSENEYVAWPDNEDCTEGAPTTANRFAEDSLTEDALTESSLTEEIVTEEASE